MGGEGNIFQTDLQGPSGGGARRVEMGVGPFNGICWGSREI